MSDVTINLTRYEPAATAFISIKTGFAEAISVQRTRSDRIARGKQ
jgi:hypothetical protein